MKIFSPASVGLFFHVRTDRDGFFFSRTDRSRWILYFFFRTDRSRPVPTIKILHLHKINIMKSAGKLYLIPITLSNPGETTVIPEDVLPQTIKRTIDFIDNYIVENEKTARKFIKSIHPDKKQPDLKISVLNKHTETAAHYEFIKPLLNGENIGLMSESGCPGIADPGAVIVKIAHEKGIQVVPLVGPSSILLALMASGMNGQSFAFNGYLPIDKNDKKQALKSFERLSQEKNQSQLFIETPYRNNKLMEDLLQILQPSTYLCVACDITLPTEYIKTKTINEWKKEKADLHNRPCIFIIHKM